jgi:hypothetical protein
MPMAYHSRPNYSLVIMYIAVAFTCLLLFLGQRVILPFFEDLTRDALLEDYQDCLRAGGAPRRYGAPRPARLGRVSWRRRAGL